MSLLRVERLSKSFGAIRAVDSVSFEVRPGEIYGLLGPNGAGKTTTISMISGLLKPDAGEVFVSGAAFWADPQKAKSIMGVVPQEIAIYEELSGRENLEFWGRMAGLSPRDAKARAAELLNALTLIDRAKDAVKTYSGGMKRRINLGCALLHRPKLLLLDEPTVGIDPQARLNILEFIRGLRVSGTAILYTTHYLEEAETLCQRIGIIDKGRVLAEGTLSELQERLGGDRVFVLEADFKGSSPDAWDGFHTRFRVIQKSEKQLVVAAIGARDPSECLKDLLGLPVRVENVTLKRPSLNDVFLQLTGRELRENMLAVLLAKDLRRAWPNPLPWLINLIVPLAMTALIGLVFGGKSDSGALGRIRFAVVDEDKSVLSDVLRGAANQREGGKFLEPVFLEREEALRQLSGSKLSAVLIIPEHFMRNYLTAREAVSLELIKNPAESIHPAVLEELLGAVVTALNALSRNFNSEFPEWQAVLEGKEGYHKVSFLIERAGEKLKTAKKLIDPPLVTYVKEDSDGTSQAEEVSTGKSIGGDTNRSAGKSAGGKSTKSKRDDSTNVFAYLLIGLAAMFLLFLGNNAMTDLHRELRKGTFERYQTMHQRLGPFIVGKVVFSVVVLLLCSAIMLGGGGLIFRVHWQHPIPLLWLTFGYSAFVAGLFAVLVALVPDERRSAVLTNVAGMALGLVGGCAFPPQQLPGFLRDHVTPLLPSNWFVETARSLQFSSESVAWGLVLLKLAVVSGVLIAMAGVLFRRRFRAGLRA